MNNPSEASKDTIPRETLVRVFWLEPYMIFVGLVAARLDRDQWYSLHRQRRCRVGAWAPNAAPPPNLLFNTFLYAGLLFRWNVAQVRPVVRGFGP